MSLPRQTASLVEAARDIVRAMPADAVLLLTETDLDWAEVVARLQGCRLLVAVEGEKLADKLKGVAGLSLIDMDPEPVPAPERMSGALRKAVNDGQLLPGAHVVVLYNGIATTEDDKPEPVDSLSLLHLDEHLERFTIHDLRRLNTGVPLDTMRLVVDLAAEIGREGREGAPVGTIFVVGDTRRVLSMCKPLNFNPFRGYSNAERDLHDKDVRNQIKEIAKLDGALIIDKEAVAVAACMYLDVPSDGSKVRRGFGSRHWSAASISRRTSSVAVCVSQSTGTVRVFQAGEVALQIEPLTRPHVWQPFRLESQDLPEDEEE